MTIKTVPQGDIRRPTSQSLVAPCRKVVQKAPPALLAALPGGGDHPGAALWRPFAAGRKAKRTRLAERSVGMRRAIAGNPIPKRPHGPGERRRTAPRAVAAANPRAAVRTLPQERHASLAARPPRIRSPRRILPQPDRRIGELLRPRVLSADHVAGESAQCRTRRGTSDRHFHRFPRCAGHRPSGSTPRTPPVRYPPTLRGRA